ncbi:uncharacterized protein LOC131180144 [Hevea brasiliensis]|uniref:uncharacterized protein LOC131180144 n=1 Tax=Hevea brasiliensis TaxID=3981 RepID=UPI0025ECB2A7|nr:uncharacterized protein LOC131180144 [Hevea brasiliensis]
MICWVVASVSEGVLPQRIGVTTAKAAWNKLVSTYAFGSKAQITDLRAQLYNLKRENSSIEIYAVCDKGIADWLAVLHHPVLDEELIEFVVAGLGPAFRLFGRMLECRTYDFSFDDLYGMLLTEERHLKHEEEATVISPLVQYSQFSSFSSSSSSHMRGRGRGNRGRGRSNYQSFASNQGHGSQSQS